MTSYKDLILSGICAAFLMAACGQPDHSHDTDHHAETAEKAHEEGHDTDQAKAHADAAHNDHDGDTAENDHDDHHDDHNDDGDTRQLGSHVHGDAMLSLALDGEVLVIELDSPLYNILGFEHAPETEMQKKNLELAEYKLNDPANLFSLNSEAECGAGEVSDVITLMDTHDDHDDHHDDDHSDHKDALLEYSYTCDAPEKLSALTVNLFDHFPEMGELETVYLGPSIQTQADLTANKRTMKLTK